MYSFLYKEQVHMFHIYRFKSITATLHLFFNFFNNVFPIYFIVACLILHYLKNSVSRKTIVAPLFVNCVVKP